MHGRLIFTGAAGPEFKVNSNLYLGEVPKKNGGETHKTQWRPNYILVTRSKEGLLCILLCVP